MPKSLTAFILIASALLTSSVSFAATQIGEVSRIRGSAYAQSDSNFRILAEGRSVHLGERLLTGRNTRLEITLEDGSKITLGDRTEFVLDEYRFKPKADIGTATFNLITGVFRAVTARIGKVTRPDFRVRTSIATLGVRGTTFWGGINFFDDRIHVALLDGKGVYATNDKGIVEITTVGYGSVIAKGSKPTAPKLWGKKKIDNASASVAW